MFGAALKGVAWQQSSHRAEGSRPLALSPDPSALGGVGPCRRPEVR